VRQSTSHWVAAEPLRDARAVNARAIPRVSILIFNMIGAPFGKRFREPVLLLNKEEMRNPSPE
jgi:hypothetical protein